MFKNFIKSLIGKLLFTLIFIWIILALIFGFTDLEISKITVDTNSAWGIFGDKYGGLPGYGLLAIAISVFIGGYNHNIRDQKIPGYVIIGIGITLLIIGLLFNIDELIFDGGTISLCLTIFLIFTFNKDWTKYRKISTVVIALAILNPLLFIRITKVLCGRVRFYDLTYPSFIEYTPWFLPPGPTSSGRSFPSGHTAMSFMLLPLLILVKDYEWKDLRKILLTILVVGWAIFVGLSRVVIGAHYASDVLFSGMMASIITIILYKKIYFDKK
ncbi:MAG: phosphatase PAP2 family protein [Promethearchaeota archaeon]